MKRADSAFTLAEAYELVNPEKVAQLSAAPSAESNSEWEENESCVRGQCLEPNDKQSKEWSG